MIVSTLNGGGPILCFPEQGYQSFTCHVSFIRFLLYSGVLLAEPLDEVGFSKISHSQYKNASPLNFLNPSSPPHPWLLLLAVRQA